MTAQLEHPDHGLAAQVLDADEWRARRDAHRQAVDELIGPYLDARRRGARHPVIDFLFTYYSSRPAHVLRWHPGFGVTIEDGDEFLGLRGYEQTAAGVSVSDAYLRPGFAFGGSCLPKDVRALQYISGDCGAMTPLVDSLIRSNEAHKHRLYEYAVAGLEPGAKVLLAGLAFKAATDDLRESPNFDLARKLLAAGFAPAYRERALLDPDMEAVMRALDFMLAQQAPYPALVVDRLWNLVMHNAPAARMMRWLLGMPPDAPIPRDGSVNVLKLTLAPDGLRPWLLNWEDVAADLLQWVQREAMGDGPGSEATRLLDELMALPGIDTAARQPNLEHAALPFLPMKLRKDGVELNLFTTITTLGTPHDVTVHELRLESFFPADEASRQWFQAAA